MASAAKRQAPLFFEVVMESSLPPECGRRAVTRAGSVWTAQSSSPLGPTTLLNLGLPISTQQTPKLGGTLSKTRG